jgi:C4-dicarboxylate-specific signal transduction histidine kinase
MSRLPLVGSRPVEAEPVRDADHETFHAALTHEITQPLSAVLLNVDVAIGAIDTLTRSDASANTEAQRLLVVLLDDIQRDVWRAVEIVAGLRAVFQCEPLSMSALDVNALVRGVASLAAARTTACGADLDLELGDPLPPVLGLEPLLTQVMLNLVLNALDAMGGDDVHARHLTITTVCCSGHVELLVSDTGPGIPGPVGERLFRDVVTTKPAGKGIGLRVASRIAAAHGGSIDVRETSCRGTTMALRLPAA